jgi:hypothetical protein
MLRQFFPSIVEIKVEEINNIFDLYFRYTKLLVNVHEEIPLISNDMNFYDFISTDDGSNALLMLINWIVMHFNNFLKMFMEHFSSRHYFNEYKLLTIPILEVNIQAISFGKSINHNDIRDIGPAILRHCWDDTMDCEGVLKLQYPEDDTLLHDCVPEIFNLMAIQDEIIQLFILNKHFVNADGIRMTYQFDEVIKCEEPPCTLLYTSVYGYDYTVEKFKNYPVLIVINND